MRHRSRSPLTSGLSLALLAGLAPGVEAVDGVRLFNQEMALVGNVTPGDQPGFPVTISRAGSYRLSGNLRVSDPEISAVEVAANNVTLDLNGFTIQGPRDQCFAPIVPVWCSGSPEGIGVVSPQPALFVYGYSNIAVVNGTVRAMGNRGVQLAGPMSRIERLTVTRNGFGGIQVGDSSIVSNSIVTENKGSGISRTAVFGGEAGLAVGNSVSNNTLEGLVRLVIRDNLLVGNNAGGPQVNDVVDAGGNICGTGPC